MNNLRGISASSPVIKVERKILDLLNVSSASPEIQLRGLHIANIYFNEGKYDLAIRHIKDFMTAKPNHYPGWILLGKIYEKKQQYGDAIDAFKLSFNIREDNTLLVKICDLLVKHNKSHKNVNISDLKYWCTKIEKIHNKHEIYFNLKKIILSCAPENERSLEEMVVLIKAELVKKPHNVDKRLELVKLYVDNSMIGDAYSYVVSIEDKQMHVDSSKWYKCLCNVYVLYAVNSQAELNFNIKFVSAVCALLTLTFSENTDKRGMIRRLDEWIQKVTSQLGNRREFKLFIDEMKAQFYFIIGVVLLKKDSQAMESNPILVDLSAMCFAASNSILPLNTTSPWWKKVDNKAFYDLWAMRANHRSSQCGNVLNDMIEQNDSNWIKMLERDYANKDGHMKLYSTLYGNSSEAQHMESFLFKSTTFIDLNIKTTSADTLVLYNNVSEDLYPNSLHLVIWRLLHSYSSCDTVIPKIEVNVFANLHLGEKDISRNDSIESLCKYDIEAFVCLTLYCSACVVDKKMSALGKREGYPVIMPDGLGDLLCSEVQQSFWTAVYNFYNNTKISTQNTTQRQLITSSLSVLRMRDNIATTGLDPRLYIQLARYFQYRWEELLDTERELPYRRARALYYWTATIDIITSTQKIEEWKSGLAQRQLNPLFILVISETDIKDTLRDCAEEGRLLMERITACEKKQVIENAFQNLSMYSDATLDDIEPFTDMDAVSDIAYSHQTPTKSTQKSINKSTYESSSQQSSINSLYMDQLSNLLTKMGRMEEKLDTALGRISDLEKNVEKNMRLNSDPVSQPLSATPSTPNMVSQQHYANHLMQQNLFTPNQYGQQFQAPMNYQSPMHNIPPQNMQNYPQMDYGRMPQRPPVRMPMQPAAQPPAPQPIVYNDEEYITIDDNLDLDSAYAAIENQYGDCGFMNQQQTKENVPAKQANISGRHQKNDPINRSSNDCNYTPADIANLEVEFPSNTNQLMSKESPMQQLMQESQSPDSNLASMKPRVVTATSKITSPSVTSAPTVTANKTLLSTPVKIPPGLWECEQCSIRNGIEVKICIACQSLRPGQGDSPKTDTGTTGQDITSSALFGKKPLSDQKSFFKPMPSGSKFISVNATPTIVTTSVQTSISTVFSQVTSSSSKPVPSSVPQDAFKFNFSSSTPQKPVESIETKTSSFTFSKSIGSIESMTKTPEKSMTETPNKKLETDLYVDEGNDGEHIFFEPICKLRDDFVMTTGEESEDILFENRAKLYRFNNNQWKERGLGDIKVLRNKDTKRGRIVMRREHILKICLNAAITPDMELMEMNVNKPGTSWIFQADDFSDGEVQRDRFAIKFKLPESATNFKNAIQDLKKEKLNESMNKSVDAASAEEDDDVIVMDIGLKPTADQIKRARALQLPDHFYLYENNTNPCIGCHGCEDKDQDNSVLDKVKPTNYESRFSSSSILMNESNFFTSQTVVEDLSSKSAVSLESTSSNTSLTTDSSRSDRIPSAHLIESLLNTPVCKPNTKAVASLASQFKANVGQWECNTCLIRNQATDNLCLACETPKPGFVRPEKEKPVVAAPVFGANGGFKIDLGNTTSTTSSPFSSNGFSSQSFTKPSETYSFGKPSATDKAPIFGSSGFSMKTNESAPIFGAKNINIKPKENVVAFGSTGFTTKPADVCRDVKVTPVFGSSDFNVNPFELSTKTSASTSEAIVQPFPFNKSITMVKERTIKPFGSSDFTSQPFATPPNEATSTGIFGKPSSFSFGAPITSEKTLADTSEISNISTPKFNFSLNKTETPEKKDPGFTFTNQSISMTEKSMTETPNKKLETDLYVDEGNDGEHIFFEPICKLRDDFVMMTGEESEDILFENRAKLYRFNNNQWKERGLGDIKVLRNKDTKRGRIVMRREHILKICLNAAITPDMELMEMNVNKPGTSWIFQADDFSDGGEVQRDRFAIKFKLPEAATKFKNAIQDFIEGNLDNSESNDEQVDDDKTTVIENNEKIFESTPTEVSKITFGSQIEPKNEPTFGIKSNGPSVISETYSFSEDVTKSTFASILKDNENSPSGFAFGKKDDNFTFTCGSKFFSSPVVADKSLNNSNAYDDVETEDRNLHFDPICHLEEVTDLKTGEEGSECVFDERSKMYRFDSNGAWKERGIGQLKILVNNETGRARIIHRREHILKLAANHLITKDMSIKYLATNLKALCWTAVDYSQHPEENEADDQSTIHDGKPEQISAKFKTDEQAAKFVKLFNHYRDVAVTTATTTTQLQDSTSNAESENYTDYEDEEEEDDNDAEESVYEERCVAKYSENNSQEFINIGDCTVSMSISVDSTFLRLTLLQDYSGDIYASHPISMNSQIKMLSVKTCEWTADDEATEIIVLRTYRLTFQTADEASMYMDKFNEGIQFAEENHNNSEQLQV